MIAVDELRPASIRRAHGTIDPVFTNSPQFVHDGLSERFGVPVIVKIETVNPIRSFKGRGTWVAVSALVAARQIGRDRAIVCTSAGNFGQGVAYAARALNVRAIVYAGLRANPAKVTRMRALGADVIQIGEAFDDARAASETYAVEHDAELLVDGQDPLISTGAGTLALEVTDAVNAGSLPAPAIASVPVGNGALINGVGSWMREEAPNCRIIGVQAEAAPAMALSLRAGRPIDTGSAATYADGIATRIAIPRAVELMAGRVDDMVLVPEVALREAQAELTEELGITVEGAAAASWAGLLAGPRPHGPALVIITGSNA
ncbi:MAG: pyridoxal-phosphate dependent enzyme [Chloroflexi bacterium]|nr:pyridoxal-phosphate dependent enzyme [Chloroflexota bacterium]